MDKVVKKIFFGKLVHGFVLKGRICWIGTELTKVLDYKDSVRTAGDFVRSKDMKIGRDYDYIVDYKLDEFKCLFDEDLLDEVKSLNKIIIFYESGVYKFLEYTRKPLALILENWLKLEIIPLLSVGEDYILDQGCKNDVLVVDAKYDKFDRLKTAIEGAGLLNKLLDDAHIDSIGRLAVVKVLFSECGIELSIYFDKI